MSVSLITLLCANIYKLSTRRPASLLGVGQVLVKCGGEWKNWLNNIKQNIFKNIMYMYDNISEHTYVLAFNLQNIILYKFLGIYLHIRFSLQS